MHMYNIANYVNVDYNRLISVDYSWIWTIHTLVLLQMEWLHARVVVMVFVR